jgi:hypothetical protein
MRVQFKNAKKQLKICKLLFPIFGYFLWSKSRNFCMGKSSIKLDNNLRHCQQRGLASTNTPTTDFNPLLENK